MFFLFIIPHMQCSSMTQWINIETHMISKIWSPKSCRHNEQFRVNNWSAKLKVEQTQYNQKEQHTKKRTVIKFIIIDRSKKQQQKQQTI